MSLFKVLSTKISLLLFNNICLLISLKSSVSKYVSNTAFNHLPNNSMHVFPKGISLNYICIDVSVVFLEIPKF